MAPAPVLPGTVVFACRPPEVAGAGRPQAPWPAQAAEVPDGAAPARAADVAFPPDGAPFAPVDDPAADPGAEPDDAPGPAADVALTDPPEPQCPASAIAVPAAPRTATAVPADEHVRRPAIPVHDSLVVRGGQPGQALPEHEQRRLRRKRPAHVAPTM